VTGGAFDLSGLMSQAELTEAMIAAFSPWVLTADRNDLQ
jgi:hypothetical protein